jgi:DedD protein
MSDSDDAVGRGFEPKHRIAGAIVLVLLVVVFLPMLLEDKPPPPIDGEEAVTEDVAPEQEKVFISRIKPLEETQPEAQGKAPPPPAGDKKSGEAAPSKPGTPPKPAAAAKPAAPKQAAKPAPPPKQTAKAAAPASGWVVRIGTFAEAENVDRATAKLSIKGFEPRTESLKSPGGPATRVWVGPFSSREQATATRDKILKETGFEGLVVSYP